MMVNANAMLSLTDRVRFRDGQVLNSDDLNTLSQHELAMLALHASQLHCDWGVAEGFTTRQLGSHRVGCDPGIAVLPDGTLVVSKGRMIISVPAGWSSRHWVLVIRASSSQSCTADCDDESPPELNWIQADEFDSTIDLGLTVAKIDSGRILIPLYSDVMRIMSRPDNTRLEFGATARPTDSWSHWSNEHFTGAQIFVDTSRMGFVYAPRYFAELNWSRFSSFDESAAWLEATGHVVAAAPDGFVFRVLDLMNPDERSDLPAFVDWLNTNEVGVKFWAVEDDAIPADPIEHWNFLNLDHFIINSGVTP